MRRAVLVVALLTLVAGSPVVDAQQTPTISTEGTTFVVQLQADGDARWRVATTFSLDTANETRAFRRYAEAFEAGKQVPGPDVTFFRRAAAQAAEVTGRQMEIRNVARTSTVDESTGTLALQFTWTEFLASGENQTLVLGDALRTPGGGTWLRSIESGQTLQVRTPPGYTIASTGNVSVTVRPNSFVVDGPQMFSNGGLLTVIYRPEPGPAPSTSPSPTPPTEDEIPWELVVGGAIVVAVALVSALTWRRRTEPITETTESTSPPAEPAPTVEPEESVEEPGAAPEEAPSEETEEELELLSDEERVERLLERNNGRMRQADIVKETDWSDAKVSQLLSKMADEGRIEKLRIGRENLISLPGYEADEE